jgi:hypothetical protein
MRPGRKRILSVDFFKPVSQRLYVYSKEFYSWNNRGSLGLAGHCATSQKVAGSFPDEVIAFFN